MYNRRGSGVLTIYRFSTRSSQETVASKYIHKKNKLYIHKYRIATAYIHCAAGQVLGSVSFYNTHDNPFLAVFLHNNTTYLTVLASVCVYTNIHGI